MKSKYVIIATHMAGDTGGIFVEKALEHNLIPKIVHLSPDGDVVPNLEGAACFVLMGGIDSVGKKKQWLREKILEGNLPTWGVCLGAQELYDAAGGTVGDAKVPQFGIYKITLTDQGLKDPLVQQTRSFQTVELHTGTALPTSGMDYPVMVLGVDELDQYQLFRFTGKDIWCSQYHPEHTEMTFPASIREYQPYFTYNDSEIKRMEDEFNTYKAAYFAARDKHLDAFMAVVAKKAQEV